MKAILLGVAAAALAGAGFRVAQDPEIPPTPPLEKGHQWLQQLVGEWESESEMVQDPSKPPMKNKGTESVRSLGGRWVILENRWTFGGQDGTGILTLGYDPQKKKYVGSWIASMDNTFWTYQGSVDAAGKVLTLETEGPVHGEPEKTCPYRDVIEVRDKDTKVLRSSMQRDGKWIEFMTITYRRKK